MSFYLVDTDVAKNRKNKTQLVMDESHPFSLYTKAPWLVLA